MNTNMTGFRWFSKVSLLLWIKVASALKGLSVLLHVFGCVHDTFVGVVFRGKSGHDVRTHHLTMGMIGQLLHKASTSLQVR